MKNIHRNIVLSLLAGFAWTTSVNAQVAQQKVGNNPTMIDPNAVLELESSSKGLLLPRLALTATNAPAPLTAHVVGMTVYNTATAGTGETAVTPGFYYNDGDKWIKISTQDLDNNLYNGNGTLTGDRIVNYGEYDWISFRRNNGVNQMEFNLSEDHSKLNIWGQDGSIINLNGRQGPGEGRLQLNQTNVASEIVANSTSGLRLVTEREKDIDFRTYHYPAGGGPSELKTYLIIQGQDGGVRIPYLNEAIFNGANTDKMVVTTPTGLLKTLPLNHTLSFNSSTNKLSSNVVGLSSEVDLSGLTVEPWRILGGTDMATEPSHSMYVTGRVAIGVNEIQPITIGGTTINPQLHVAGNVSITGKYYTTNSVYADYVFEKYFDGASDIFADYEFKSLGEVAAFIKENKHLPGVTPIGDLQKSDAGYTIDLTNLSVELLEKTEELFLHTIEQQEQIEAQQKTLLDLTERLERLEKLMSDK